MNNGDYYAYTAQFFRRLAPIYNLLEPFVFRVRAKAVEIANPKKTSKVLDVCTGTGQQAFAFARTGCDVTGIDMSKDMLDVARKNNRYANAKFKLMDAAKMSFPANHFDISCISFALHDMPLAIRKKVLQETMRVTRSSGKIIIIDHAIPANWIKKALVQWFGSLYETKYYPGYMDSDPRILFKGLIIEKRVPVLSGCAHILKARIK